MKKQNIFLKETIYNSIKYQVLRHKSNRDEKELYEKSYKIILKNVKEEQN